MRGTIYLEQNAFGWHRSEIQYPPLKQPPDEPLPLANGPFVGG